VSAIPILRGLGFRTATKIDEESQALRTLRGDYVNTSHQRRPCERAEHEADLETERRFPLAAGVFFGLGLGGFFDGIVLHQVLQWQHMLSNWYPVNTIENLELNSRWDGVSSTYILVLIGLHLLWRTASTIPVLVLKAFSSERC
jgi:Predicted membrane protein (DUF2243)